MIKVGLFGGSFDPIHKAHIKLAEMVLAKTDLDEIWFVLAYDQPLKSDHNANFSDRANMIKLAISHNSKLKLCEIEKDLPKPSYTYNTIIELQKKYPNNQFKWIMGADSLASLNQWYKYQELEDLIDFIIVDRNNSLADYKGKHLVLDFYEEDSSSKIRQGHFKYLDKQVLDYVLTNRLYLEAIVKERLSEKRYKHVMRCVDLAMELAPYHDLLANDIYLATILHDIAKEIDPEVEMAIMQKHYHEHLEYHPKVYHQFTGAFITEHEFMISDPKIIGAIRHHTTGDSDDNLAQLVYLVDKLERGRKYPVEEYIKLSKEDFKQAFAVVKAKAEQAVKEKEIEK
ncbi:MAG: nicotinate (nicotinamide) nucleotide adenylyltransferase [Erysipelothrix sp.]|nr:nicotinate (nicotinamide) nucleotide adenylyltransferase [Erysipelothrix sp.]